jgi:hypothetical protein
MNAHARIESVTPRVADDLIEGAEEIAKFLGPQWTKRKVYYAKERGGLPIRAIAGIGMYAFKSELIEALKAPKTLPK